MLARDVLFELILSYSRALMLGKTKAKALSSVLFSLNLYSFMFLNTTTHYRLIKLCYGEHASKELLIYTFSRRKATLAFIWSRVFGHLMNVSPIFTLLLALFWSPPISERNVWPFSH